MVHMHSFCKLHVRFASAVESLCGGAMSVKLSDTCDWIIEAHAKSHEMNSHFCKHNAPDRNEYLFIYLYFE